jgi:hypothetical protein
VRFQHFSNRIAGAVLVIVTGLGPTWGVLQRGDTGTTSSVNERPGLALADDRTEEERDAPADPAPVGAARGKHALLIGVTYYENLAKSDHLYGPENDTRLMKDLLTKRYGFPEANVRILSEHAAGDSLPTRKNIERECKHLAEVARPGDQVVVVMGCHGSLQPQSPDAPFPQPDGFERIFAPRDVGKWDGHRQVTNCIRGDELGAWLRPISEKKAYLFVVLDACHSGNGIRAVNQEKKRQLDPEAKGGLEIPKAAMVKAAKLAAERGLPPGEKNRGIRETSALPLHRMDGVVVLYACQSTEYAVELPLPAGATDCKPYGLLTFTINQILARTEEPLTYLELAQRVQSQYSRLGRNCPTPVLEGKDQNREVLGLMEHPGRSLIRLVKVDDEMKVTCGLIHGLTEQSILAVYPPAGVKGDKPLGHVRVTSVETGTATVEPCRFKNQPANDKLPQHCRCEVVSIDYGDMKVKVAVDPLDHHGKTVLEATRTRLIAELSKLAGAEDSILATVSEPAKADWLLRVDSDKLYLVPASGLPAPADGNALPPLFGPYPDDEKLTTTLAGHLGRIARVQNLKKLATDPAADLARSHADETTDSGVKVDLKIRLLKDKTDKQGEHIAWPGPGVTLYDGDLVQFRVHNPNPFPVDITLLYIDSDCGISCLFPQGGEVSRLDARTTRRINTKLSTEVQALEHLVVIAVKSQKLQQPVDFACLEQASLEKAKDVERTRGATTALQTPLGRLLQHSLYGNHMEGTRSAARADVEESALVLCTWHVVPGKRP